MKKMKKSLTFFQIAHPTQKSFIFCAQSEEDMEGWINAILVEIFREFITYISRRGMSLLIYLCLLYLLYLWYLSC